jgi:two-component system cell cycle response regulator
MGDESNDKTARVDAHVTLDPVAGHSAMPCIMHFSDANNGKVYWLSRDKQLTIGRAPENDVCIRDQLVSQLHARVVISSEGVVIVEDRGSTNGTYVNGEKVTRHELRDGDKILIRPHHLLKFCYQINSAPVTAGQSGADTTRDTVTGIYTRQFMLTRIDEGFIHAKKQNQDLALLMFEVDGFGKINETYGQDTGEMVLREITTVVSSMLRREDDFARYGNETFVILLRNLSEAAVVVLAQRIRRAVKYHQFFREGEKILVTVSLGIGSLITNMKNAMDLIREVQTYLEKATSTGHDTINGHRSVRAIFRQIASRHVA